MINTPTDPKGLETLRVCSCGGSNPEPLLFNHAKHEVSVRHFVFAAVHLSLLGSIDKNRVSGTPKGVMTNP